MPTETNPIISKQQVLFTGFLNDNLKDLNFALKTPGSTLFERTRTSAAISGLVVGMKTRIAFNKDVFTGTIATDKVPWPDKNFLAKYTITDSDAGFAQGEDAGKTQVTTSAIHDIRVGDHVFFEKGAGVMPTSPKALDLSNLSNVKNTIYKVTKSNPAAKTFEIEATLTKAPADGVNYVYGPRDMYITYYEAVKGSDKVTITSEIIKLSGEYAGTPIAGSAGTPASGGRWHNTLAQVGDACAIEMQDFSMQPYDITILDDNSYVGAVDRLPSRPAGRSYNFGFSHELKAMSAVEQPTWIDYDGVAHRFVAYDRYFRSAGLQYRNIDGKGELYEAGLKVKKLSDNTYPAAISTDGNGVAFQDYPVSYTLAPRADFEPSGVSWILDGIYTKIASFASDMTISGNHNNIIRVSYRCKGKFDDELPVDIVMPEIVSKEHHKQLPDALEAHEIYYEVSGEPLRALDTGVKLDWETVDFDTTDARKVTAYATTTGVITSAAHGLVLGDMVMFIDLDETRSAPITNYTPYYVTPVDVDKFTVTDWKNGTAIAITGAGDSAVDLKYYKKQLCWATKALDLETKDARGDIIFPTLDFEVNLGNNVNLRPDMNERWGFKNPLITSRATTYRVTIEEQEIAKLDAWSLVQLDDGGYRAPQAPSPRIKVDMTLGSRTGEKIRIRFQYRSATADRSESGEFCYYSFGGGASIGFGPKYGQYSDEYLIIDFLTTDNNL